MENARGYHAQYEGQIWTICGASMDNIWGNFNNTWANFNNCFVEIFIDRHYLAGIEVLILFLLYDMTTYK